MSPHNANISLPELPHQEEVPEDSLQFLWAVSYCDLLMVLVSFLVLFFQPENAAKESMLKNIIASLQKEVAVNAAAEALKPKSLAPAALDNLAKNLKSEDAKLLQSALGRSITIDLADNLYDPGAYAFPIQEQARLERILTRILPESKNLLITFIGHADETKIMHGHGAVIDSNLVLSNLRAARAVEIAYKFGFEPKTVAGQGAGEFSRKTRSLTLKITERNSP